MKRAREQAGFTLIELSIAATLSLIVFGATMSMLVSMIRQRDRVDKQTTVETQTRQGIDRLSRQLRNLASPADIITVVGSTQPKSVDRNEPYDLIFKDVADVRPAGSLNSANVRRVRYCLQTSDAVPGAGFTASPSRGVLWMQLQTWTTALPPALPATTDCPGTGWPSQTLVAYALTNVAASPPRAVFRYSGDAGAITDTTPEAREAISRIEATVSVDEDPLRDPVATSLTSSVMLRNQNRAPIARFVYTLLLQSPATCSIQLNGSASEDPESKPLKYEWWIDSAKQTEDGVVIQKVVSKGTHVYELRVYDRAGLRGTYTETYPCL